MLNQVVADELKAQLKIHLDSSLDEYLIEKMQSDPAPDCLQEIATFKGVNQTLHQVRSVLVLALLEELEENGASLVTDWALGLLQFPGFLLPLRQPQPRKQIALIEKFYCKYMARLLVDLKVQASTNTQGIRWVYGLIDQWRRHYEQITHIGFTKAANIRITIPEPNPYAQENEAGYLYLMHIFHAFEKGNLSSIPWRELAPKAQFGGYLFILICLSGVSHQQLKRIADLSLMKKNLDTPLSSLLLPIDSSLKLEDVYHFADLASGKNQTHRWIPDPVSAALYQRLRKGWKFQTQAEAQKSGFYSRCIQDFMSSLKDLLAKEIHARKSSLNGGEIYLLKKALNYFTNTSQLIQASKIYQTRSLPAIIWHRLASDFDTKDLGFPSLDRLGVMSLSDLSMPTGMINIPEEIAPPEDTGQSIDRAEIDNHWVHSCLKIFKGLVNKEYSPLEAIALIEQSVLALELGPESLFARLGGWMQWIIHQATDKTVSTLEYPKIFLGPMVQLYEIYADFQDLDAPSRIDEYDVLEIESRYNNQQQEKLRRAWNSFHAYLIEIGHIDVSQFTPITMDSKLSRVGSQYISEPEFELARHTLYKKSEHSLEFRNICLLTLTLSYRLGLRRSEVGKLGTNHISFFNGKMKSLSIQWWIERRLKSTSSTRILPMIGLLEERESLWLELMTVARKRGLWVTEDIFHATKEELAALIRKYEALPIIHANNFLFLKDECLDGGLKSTSAVNEIIDLIHEALRAPGGSSRDLRFHHLRHACATNMLLLLLSKHLPNSKKYFLNMVYGNPSAITQLHLLQRGPLAKHYSDINVCTEDFDERSAKARSILLAGDDSSSSDVYAVSRLLGHSSPMTTLMSYIHVIDLLVGAFLNERFCGFDDRFKSAIHLDFKAQLEDRTKNLKDKKNKGTLLTRKKLGRPKKSK